MQPVQLRRVARATVWKGDRPAALLVRTQGGTRFEYLPDYDGAEVASTLPRASGPLQLAAGALPPFFSGLLPEGRRLGAIRRATKTSTDDELTLLLAVGEDSIGDVRVLPEGKLPAAGDVGPPPPALAEVAFDELFASVIGPELRDRVALPGAQDKVSSRMITLPIAHQGSECILKLDPPEVPHLVVNEAFFLRAARASGIEVALAGIVQDRDGKPGLLVRRFDRITVGSERHRLPQEDACQVLGRYPADKYHVTTEEVIRGLAALTTAPLVAARALLRQFAFAYLCGNGDAHAKNFSVVQREGEWQLAPAYDLPSTLPYGDTTLALTLDGKDREEVGRRDFVQLGRACGVLPKATERVLDDLLAVMPLWFDRLDELPFDARVLHKLKQACRYRARRLAGSRARA